MFQQPRSCLYVLAESPCEVRTECVMSSMTLFLAMRTDGRMPYFMEISRDDIFGKIWSKHAVASLAKSAIVTWRVHPYSNESILWRAGSMAVRPGWPPHCSSVSVCLVLAMIFLGKNIFKAVLNSALTRPIICSWCILHAPAFFQA